MLVIGPSSALVGENAMKITFNQASMKVAIRNKAEKPKQ
jgi:hypothetical protein